MKGITIRPSPFKGDRAVFIEVEDLIIAVSVTGTDVWLEDRRLDAALSIPFAAIPVLRSVLLIILALDEEAAK
jgi:hypothetical protein